MGRPAGGAVLCGKANEMFMRTVQQNVLVPHPEQSASHIVTDPQLSHKAFYSCYGAFLDQKVMARKAKARKCTDENVGNIRAKVDR